MPAIDCYAYSNIVRTVFVDWHIGPNEVYVEVEVAIEAGEPPVYHGCYGSDPGSPETGRLENAVAEENGERRDLTDEEWNWLEADREKIEAEAVGK